MMGAVFFRKQQFEDALLAYERLQELLVDVYGQNSPEVEGNNGVIVTLKERIGIGGRGHQKRDTAAALVKAQELFRENHECVDIRERLYIHSGLVRALREDGRHQEAMEQLEKILAESRQSLGPNHPDTLLFENETNGYRQWMLQSDTPMASNSSATGATVSEKKDVWAVIECEQQSAISGQRVQVLRATRDAQKYICLIKNHNGVSSKFKVTHNQCILETGTTVVVHGLVSSADLNGSIGIIRLFDKEKQRYAVSVGKKKTTVSIKPINLNVVFA
jgi:tetratricopeptide (TPR) repeat protein